LQLLFNSLPDFRQIFSRLAKISFCSFGLQISLSSSGYLIHRPANREQEQQAQLDISPVQLLITTPAVLANGLGEA